MGNYEFISFNEKKEEIILGKENRKNKKEKLQLIGIYNNIEETGEIVYTLCNEKEKCNDFLINTNSNIPLSSILGINKISLTMKNKKIYFIIEDFNIISTKEKIKDNLILYELSSEKIFEVNNLFELKNINQSCLITIHLLHIKENNRRKFIDADNNYINIKLSKNHLKKKFEQNEIYTLSNFYWDTYLLNECVISDIKKFSKLELEKSKFLENIDNIEINKIISLKGNISFISFEQKLIKVNNNNILIYLNDNLIQNISFTGINYLYNLKVVKKNILNITNITKIIFEEFTYLHFYFIDYSTNNYFTKIKIDDKIYLINKKEIIIETSKNLDYKYNAKEIILTNNNNNILSFKVYIYKGHTNKINCFINNNNGIFYEILYFFKNKSHLPKKIIIEDFELNNYDIFFNEYRIRYNIMNTKEIGIINNDLTSLYNSWQKIVLISMNNEYFNYSISKIKKKENKKRKFKMEKEFENKLSMLYKNYKYNINLLERDEKEIKEKYSELFKKIILTEEKSEISTDDEKSKESENEDNESQNDIELFNNNTIDYREYLKNGHADYYFKDTRKEYKKIKKLCFLFLVNYTFVANIDFIKYYIKLLNKIKNLLNRDKIKILLGYTNEIIIHGTFVHLKNINELKETNPYYLSYLLMNQIYENLNENSALFIPILQFNSNICFNFLNNHHCFNCSLLNINEIKMDLIRVTPKYFFISNEVNTGRGEYNEASQVMLINEIKMFKSDNNLIDKKVGNEAKSFAVNISIENFHERIGHAKKDIINYNQNTPKYFFNIQFQIEKFEYSNEEGKKVSDSGYILEKNIFDKKDIIDIMRLSRNVETLYNYKLYVDKNFEELLKEVNSISKKYKLDVSRKRKKDNENDEICHCIKRVRRKLRKKKNKSN